jgi:hypothetical protein
MSRSVPELVTTDDEGRRAYRVLHARPVLGASVRRSVVNLDQFV